MMKKRALLTVFTFCQAVLAVAQDQPAAMYQGQMDRLDRNRDGAVDRSEYQAFMVAAFARLDKNKDGRLSSDDVSHILNAQQFAATDANGDGTISQEEFLDRVMADFEAADRNGDGKL